VAGVSLEKEGETPKGVRTLLKRRFYSYRTTGRFAVKEGTSMGRNAQRRRAGKTPSAEGYINLVKRSGDGTEEAPFHAEPLKTLPRTDENLRLVLKERDMRRVAKEPGEFYLMYTLEPLTEVVDEPNRKERRQRSRFLSRLLSKLPRSRRAPKASEIVQKHVDDEVDLLFIEKAKDAGDEQTQP